MVSSRRRKAGDAVVVVKDNVQTFQAKGHRKALQNAFWGIGCCEVVDLFVAGLVWVLQEAMLLAEQQRMQEMMHRERRELEERLAAEKRDLEASLNARISVCVVYYLRIVSSMPTTMLAVDASTSIGMR